MKIPSYLQKADVTEKAWLFLCACGLFLFHGLRDFFIIPAIFLPVGQSDSTGNQLLHGFALSSCHFGIMIGYLIIPFIIQKWSLDIQLRGSLFFTGFFALFIWIAASNAWAITIIRGLQGIAQSWIYIITYAVLQKTKIEKFSTIYTIIFFMPWFGSAVGLTIGCTGLPQVAGYLFGALSIILSIGTLLLPKEGKFEMGSKQAWRETLTSKSAFCTATFHAGNSLALHTILIGLPSTLLLFEEDGLEPLIWSFLVGHIVLVTGICTRFLGLLRVWFINSSLLSVLKRRKLLTLGGVLVTVVCLMLAGTLGRTSKFGLIAPCILGATIGGSISLSTARMCFHDLAPCFPIPIMHIGNIAASFGAAVASLMFLGITRGADDNDSYVIAWSIPALIEVILVGPFIFFLTVDTLPHQFSNVPDKQTEVPTISLTLARPFRTDRSKSVDDTKSFKSIRSVFISIPSSYGRKPSGSFISMDDVDLEASTVWNSESGICRSITQEKDLDMRSVKSSLSYKSAILENPKIDIHRSIEKSHSNLDRTYEWLHACQLNNNGHHSHASNHDEREKAQRNMLLALQW